MKKILIYVFAAVLATVFVQPGFAANDAAKKLQADFPDLPYQSVAASPVKGIYEVLVEQGVYYYAPRMAF